MLAVRHVSKAFGATQANADVSLEIEAGEIVGLVGENGAGKSTLLSIIAGFMKPDAGEVLIDGQATQSGSPLAARNAGIGMVHQHLSLVPTFTVREQVALAGWREQTLPGLLAGDLDGDAVIEHLPLGKRQRLEIAKSMIANPKVLLLDEPTSILAPTEVEALFELLNLLRDDGTSIVIVTHKLREVMSIADRIVVMTNGRIAGSLSRVNETWPDATEGGILSLMFDLADEPDVIGGGGPPERGDRLSSGQQSPTVLALSGVGADRTLGSQQLRDIEYELSAGRVHAIVGVDGQGQTELAETIAGYRLSAGSIQLAGQNIAPQSAAERAEAGIGLLVDDRLGEAAVGSFTVAENLALKRPRDGKMERWGFLRGAAMTDHAQSTIDGWDVHPRDPEIRFDTLSGGNMQRILAARELDRTLKVLVAVNPVHGLDVRTTAFMWRQMRVLCNDGGAVLYFTSDLDEAIEHSDLLAVMFDGRVSPMTAPHQTNRGELGSMMVNGW
ncbi:ABC transporter ATP-binding protein [soil metagenome]